MEIAKVKVIELIRDWSLWPRYEANDLDSTNVKQLKEAVIAGCILPPIVASKKDLRIIDGFHRQQVYISLFGESHEIDVELREYKNDKEMFVDAIRMNASQGLKLSQKDRVHCFHKARRLKLPIALIAEAVGMSKEYAQKFIESRTATDSKGEKIPLSAGAMHLAGKKLSTKQEKFARTANGMLPIVNVRLLLNALRASCCPLTQKEIELLLELRDEIDKALGKIAA